MGYSNGYFEEMMEMRRRSRGKLGMMKEMQFIKEKKFPKHEKLTVPPKVKVRWPEDK